MDVGALQYKQRYTHLVLFNIDVGDVEPDVAELGRGLSNLCKDHPSLGGVSFVSQNTADTVRRPDVLWVISQNLNWKK